MYAKVATPRMAAWAPTITWSSCAGSTLEKWPSRKMIVLTIVREMTKIAADVKAGRHGAESHNSIGNSSSTGTTTSHQWSGSKKMVPALAAATEKSATIPSSISRRGGGV